MNNQTQKKLAELVERYGPILYEDPRRLEAMLRDLCGECRREIHLLVNAGIEQVPKSLLEFPNSVPLEVIVSRLTKRLMDHLGVTEKAARWAVVSWGVALGVISHQGIGLLEEELETKHAFGESLGRPQCKPPALGTLTLEQTTPSYFTKSENGIITDHKTGLEWYVGPDRNITWDEADAWVNSLQVGGTGWRFPTHQELGQLYQPGLGTRNMPPCFVTTGWWAWSEARDSYFAWYFNFDGGLEHWCNRLHSFGTRAFAVRFRKIGNQTRG